MWELSVEMVKEGNANLRARQEQSNKNYAEYQISIKTIQKDLTTFVSDVMKKSTLPDFDPAKEGERAKCIFWINNQLQESSKKHLKEGAASLYEDLDKFQGTQKEQVEGLFAAHLQEIEVLAKQLTVVHTHEKHVQNSQNATLEEQRKTELQMFQQRMEFLKIQFIEKDKEFERQLRSLK